MHSCLRVLHSVIMSCGWTFADCLPLSLRGLVVSFCLWSEPNVRVSVRSFQRCGFSLLSARFLADILALHHLITPLQYWRSNLSTHSLPGHYSSHSASLFNCFQVAFVFPCTYFWFSFCSRTLTASSLHVSGALALTKLYCPLTFCCPFSDSLTHIQAL